jgi:hypothetical protein
MYQVPSEEFLRQNEINQNKRGKKIGILFMVGSVLITIILGFFAYRSFEKYSWSETKGTVSNSSYFESITDDEARYSYDYEYIVDGVAYTGNDSNFGKRTVIDEPPANGASITVYYNPNDPSESLVDTNYSGALSDAVVWTLCCGPIFFLFGALVYFLSTRKRQTLQS